MPTRNKIVGEVDAEELRERYQEADDDTEFNEDEIRWLQDHGVSQPGEFDPQPVTFRLPDGTVVSNDPSYAATLQVSNQEAFDELVEQRAKQLAKEMVALEMQTAGHADQENTGSATGERRSGGPVSHPPDNSAAGEGVDEEMPDDYNDWKVSDLRAEISARNEDRAEEDQLDLTGNKDALVAVLEEDDKE